MNVYRDFDQETLEREYSAKGTVSDALFDEIIGRYAAESARARDECDCAENIAYGSGADEVVDIFPAGDGAPVLVFVHGGYWRMLSQRESAFMAPAFGARGAATVAVNYSLAPGASLDTIVRQCRAAIAFIHREGGRYGIDPDRIFIAGSSAGGHLVGMLIAGGWHQEFGVPEDVIKGCCALSGLHDLEPLQHCLPNSWLDLDPEMARRNSPQHHIPARNGCPLIVSYGGNETNEFKRQTDDFAAAWRARGHSATHIDMNQTNHFDIVLDFMNPEGALTRAMFDLMGI